MDIDWVRTSHVTTYNIKWLNTMSNLFSIIINIIIIVQMLYFSTALASLLA